MGQLFLLVRKLLLSDPKTGKMAPIMRCLEDWPVSVSWGPLSTPSDAVELHITMVLRGLRGPLNWAPILPREGISMDIQCDI